MAFPTMAESRHPEVSERTKALRESDEYRHLRSLIEQVLTDVGDLDRGAQIRFLHDWLTSVTADVQVARGRVIHDLHYDHAYEEIAAMCGLSRQRVREIHLDWLDKTSTTRWPDEGRWSRIQARRNAERAVAE